MRACVSVLLLGLFLSTPEIVLAEEPKPAEAPPEAVEESSSTSTSQPSPAGQTRAETWKALKTKRLQTLKPFKVGRIERLLVSAEKGSLQIAPGGVSPLIGTVSSGSGPSIGGRWDGSNVFGGPFDLRVEAEVSTKAYQSYSLQIGRLQNDKTTFVLEPTAKGFASEFNEKRVKEPGFVYYADLSYRYFPQEDFYGIGGDSLKSNVTDYMSRMASYEGVFGFQANQWLGLSLRGGFVEVDIDAGQDERYSNTEVMFTPSQAPGLLDQPDFLRASLGLLADYRDRPHDAHAGGMFGAVVTHVNDRGSGQYEFNRISLETRQYLPLWSPNRRLAFRALTTMDRPMSGATVPFYFYEPLGGSSSLRGFREFRFRDRNLLLLSAEYRWDAAEFLQMVAFYDTGKVFARMSEFDLNRLEKGYGVGVRFKGASSVFLRVEFAHSREGNRLHFKLGPAF